MPVLRHLPRIALAWSGPLNAGRADWIASRARRVVEPLALATGARASPPRQGTPFVCSLAKNRPDVIAREVVSAEELRDTSGLEFFDHDEANERFLPSFVTRIRGGCVFRHGVSTSDAILIGDLSIESGVLPTDADRHPLLELRSIPRYRTLEGTAVAVNGVYSSGYYHWMLEVLPRLVLLLWNEPHLLAQKPPILVESWGQTFQRDTIRWLGIDPHQIRPVDHASYRVADLVVPTLPGLMMHPPPWAVACLDRMLSPPGGWVDNGSPRRRLLVSRGDQTRRRMRNEEALSRALTSIGFEVVDPGRMTVEQQARMFRDAEMVVASHGGALTNLLFCQRGTRVIEIFSPAYRPPCFFLISRHRQLDYTPLFGRPVPPGRSRENFEADLDVDVNAVMRILSA